jgi:hypothetical protein
MALERSGLSPERGFEILTIRLFWPIIRLMSEEVAERERRRGGQPGAQEVLVYLERRRHAGRDILKNLKGVPREAVSDAARVLLDSLP